MRILVFIAIVISLFACNSCKNVETTDENMKQLVHQKKPFENLANNEILSDTTEPISRAPLGSGENKKKTNQEFDSEAVRLNEEANKMYTDAFVFSPQNETTLLDSGLILVNEAIMIDSTYYPAYETKVNILFHQKKYKKAIEVLKRIIRIKDDNASYIMTVGIYYDILGLKDLAGQKYDEALVSYKNLLSNSMTHKDSIHTLNDIAILLCISNKESEALEFVDSLTNANPDESIFESMKNAVKNFDKDEYLSNF